MVATALVVWLAFDVLSARRDLNAARGELSTATSGLGTATDDQASAVLRKATLDAVARTKRAERRLERNPLLTAAGVVPGVGTQRDGLLGAVRAARAAAEIGDTLTAKVAGLNNALTIQRSSVDLAAVAQLSDAAGQAGDALRSIKPTHRDAQWGPLGHATSQLDHVIADTQTRLQNAAGVLHVAHGLMGADDPKRLFIALQNNAEMRDQGMVLSYAVAEATNGALHVVRAGSIQDLALRNGPVTDVALPAGTKEIFGQVDPLVQWQGVNATADTAITGAAIRSMYRSATGDTVDGVIALDVPAIAALLSVTGPVTVPGIPEAISADNADRVLLNDLYQQNDAGPAGRANRQRLLADVGAAVINRIEAGGFNTTTLVRALGTAASGGHLWVTSAVPDDQPLLERAGLGGRPGRVHPERSIHIAVQNGTANKLDWFVDPKVDVDVAIAADGTTALINTTVTVTNTAPVPTPSSEQFGPDGIVTNVAGLYRARVYFWGPSTGDQLGSVEESGLRVNYITQDVRAGETKSVSFSTAVPNAVKDGVLTLRFVPQPRVRPMTLHVNVGGLGWKARKNGNETQPWSRTLDLSWRMHRSAG